MPSKGRQRASRQAQLRKNSKKSSRKNKQIVTSRPSDQLAKLENTDVEPAVVNMEPTKVAKNRPKPATSQVVQQTSGARQDSGALEYPYLKGELRQIGLTSSLIIIGIVVLTFIPWS